MTDKETRLREWCRDRKEPYPSSQVAESALDAILAALDETISTAAFAHDAKVAFRERLVSAMCAAIWPEGKT